MKNQKRDNPFQLATLTARRLKILVYGPAGVGKTFFGLGGPSPRAIIDLEGGSAHYGDHPVIGGFDRVATKSLAQIEEAVGYIEESAFYQTLIVDPVSVLWQLLQEMGLERALRRNDRNKRYKKEEEDVSLTQADWGKIKQRINSLYTRLNNLPCNVVLIARQKEIVEQDAQGNIHVVGLRPEAEKNTVYNMDTVLRLEFRGKKRVGVVEKDRTGRYQIGEVIEEPSLSLWTDNQTEGGADFTLQRDDEIAEANASMIEQEEAAQAQKNRKPPRQTSRQAPAPRPQPVPPPKDPKVEEWEKAVSTCWSAFRASGFEDIWMEETLSKYFGAQKIQDLSTGKLETFTLAIETSQEEPTQEETWKVDAIAPDGIAKDELTTNIQAVWSELSPWEKMEVNRRRLTLAEKEGA